MIQLGRLRWRHPAPSIDRLVLRCLTALGPASVMDVQAWPSLTRLREVTDRLRPDLRTFRDEAGRELLHLPDVPARLHRPAAALVPLEFDNGVLGHADRFRIPGDASAWRFA
jgi:hypothetical protein